MTAATLHRLPLSPEAQHRLNRIATRQHLVEDAREALRHPELWADHELRSRCSILKAYGDDADILQADAMLLSLQYRGLANTIRPHQPLLPAPPPTRGNIRRALWDLAVLAGFGAAVLIFYIGGPL